MASEAQLSLVVGLRDQASKGLKSLGGLINGLGKATTGLAVGGLAAGAAGVAALSGVLVQSIGNARESTAVLAQTEAVIKSTGGVAGFTAQQISDMAGALSAAEGKSLFGSADIQRGQNLLLTFTNIRDTLPEATSVMVDMAQALGTDVKGGAVALGKALNDPIKGIAALGRVGVTFTEQQQGQIKAMVEAGKVADAQRIILAELNREFGGSAAAAAAANGGFAQLQDQWGEMTEGIGKELLPAVVKLMSFLTGPQVQGAAQFLADALVGGLTTAIDWLTGTALPAVQGFVQEVQHWFDIMGGGGDGAGAVIQLVIDKIGELFPALRPVTDFLSRNFWPAWEAGERAVGVVRDSILTFIQAFNGDWQNSDGILLIHQAFGEIGIAVGIARDAVLTFIQAYQGNWENSDQILLIHQAFGVLGQVISGTVVPAIQSVIGWLQENWSWLSQIAVAVGVAVAAFSTISTVVGIVASVVATFGAIAGVIGPIVALVGESVALVGVMQTVGTVLGVVVAALGGPVAIAIGAVALAVGALYLAWTTNFLGIQQIVASAWATMQPIFAQVVAWLGTNIPAAAASVAAFWNGALLPALQTVWSFIQTSVIPLLTTLATSVLTALGAAISTLAAFWTGTLQPALQAVWSFIQGNIVPLFQALANVYLAALRLALTAMAGIWQNVLLPAIQAVWSFIAENLSPILAAVASTFTNTLSPAVNSAGSVLSTVLGPAINTVTGFFSTWGAAIGGVSSAIQGVIGWLNGLASKLNTIHLPAWMTPGSPTPWEIGMWGVARSTKAATAETGTLSRTLSALDLKNGGSDTGPAKAIADTISGVADAISKGIDAYAKLGSFLRPDTTSIQSFASATADTVQIFINTAKQFKAKAIEAAGVFADGAGKLIGIIGSGADALAKLPSYAGVTRDQVVRFANDIAGTVATFIVVIRDFNAKAVDAAAAWSESAGKIVAVIAPGVEAFTKLADFKGLAQAALDAFGEGLRLIVAKMLDLASQFDVDGVAAAATFGEAVLHIVSPIGEAADAFTKLASYKGFASWVLDMLGADVRLAVTKMLDLASQFSGDGVRAADAFVQSAGTIATGIGNAIDALSKVSSYKGLPDGALTTFFTDLQSIMQQSAQLASTGFADVWQQSFELLTPDMGLALQTTLQMLTDFTIRPWLKGQEIVLNVGGRSMATALGAGFSGASGDVVGKARQFGADLAAAVVSGFGKPTLTVTINSTGGNDLNSASPISLFGKRANGGPVSGGVPYWVGERGRELVVPSTSGTVVPNNLVRQLQAAFVPAPAERAVSSQPPITYVSITVNNDANEILDALRQVGAV